MSEYIIKLSEGKIGHGLSDVITDHRDADISGSRIVLIVKSI